MRRGLLAVASVGVLLAAAAACRADSVPGGNGDGRGLAAGSGEPWILGTTQAVASVDPAGSSDGGSSTLQYAIFEQLLSMPAGGGAPVADAAESCVYDGPQTLTCTLKDGLTFSNGHDLTSSDVRFSLERIITMADVSGASDLLAAISDSGPDPRAVSEGAIETPDETTVVFHLNRPDASFVNVLTRSSTSIVDEETFPAERLLGDEEVVGSGPYKLSLYEPGEQAVLEANESYEGDRSPKSPQIFVQYFREPSRLKRAVEVGDVDIAWRTLGPNDLEDLATNENLEVLKGTGSELRYWVWQLDNGVAKDLATRRAVAQIIDRDAIAKDSYDGTVVPTYSVVPPGLAGRKDSFKESYGAPDVELARKLLDDAGIDTPVTLTLGYTPDHYGPNTVDEANQLAAQLNASGLFAASTEGAEWPAYQTLHQEGAYDLFIAGHSPDFLDSDSYLSPLLRDGGLLTNGYSGDEVTRLLDEALAETDPAARDEVFGRLQDMVAEDVPLIPSWNGQNAAVADKGMEGVEGTLDATCVFRFWQVTKTG